MKLQLENIQGYLAHGLKVKNLNPFNDYSGGKEILTIDGTYYLYPESKEPIFSMSFKEYSTGKSFDSCTPILRKLELTKIIKVKGVEIIPIVELAKIAFPLQNWELGVYVAVAEYIKDDIHFWYVNSVKSFSNNFKIYTPNQLQLFKWLYANLYDVDGLIDAGLAIDADTLEINPYNS